MSTPTPSALGVLDPDESSPLRSAFPNAVTMGSFSAQAKGLIGMREIDPETAYLFPGCRSVHTLFMSAPIDVVVCDRELRVLNVETMQPWRLGSKRVRGAHTIVEAASGSAASAGIAPGCRLRVLDDLADADGHGR